LQIAIRNQPTGGAENGIGNELDNVITGNISDNNLIGGNGNDTIIGATGSDDLIGGSGNDILDGSTGDISNNSDTLLGGLGDDLFKVNSANDVVNEDTNAGIDTVESSATFTIVDPDVENLTLVGNAAINGTGNDNDNFIRGNSAANTLTGKGGKDTLAGGGGNDIFVINDADGDVILEATNGGTDTVVANVTRTMANNLENLVQFGTTSIDAYGNLLSNRMTGNTSNNDLYGNAGNDTINGAGGSDRIYGGLGNDAMYGAIGNDLMYGQDGSDRIYGGLGSDTLVGGAGFDRFAIYSPGEGIDRIVDFAPVFDTMLVSASGFGGGLTAGGYLNASSFHLGASAVDASDRFIYNANNGALYFDVDGIGGATQLQIAKLNPGLSMTHTDIYVIG
jgi:Ca2+-binding RTX toxin-like protein